MIIFVIYFLSKMQHNNMKLLLMKTETELLFVNGGQLTPFIFKFYVCICDFMYRLEIKILRIQ